jgi:hypothetical protein
VLFRSRLNPGSVRADQVGRACGTLRLVSRASV